jgi:hypothetical protein
MWEKKGGFDIMGPLGEEEKIADPISLIGGYHED